MPSFLKGQDCAIQLSDTVICAGQTINFTATYPGGITAYNWNFGDGFNATVPSPFHTYTLPGIYVPSVTLSLSSGGTCSVSGGSIRVFAKPSASFALLSDDTICFKNNELCIQDLSVPGSSSAPIKRRITQLSNGYLQIDSGQYDTLVCYRNNADLGGHRYNIVVEVTDTNNCVDRQEMRNAVLLYPRFPIGFSMNFAPSCNPVTAQFTNNGLVNRLRIRRFVWDFGDGTADSVNWLSTSHLFPGSGLFVPRLLATDTTGCSDTIFAGVPVGSIQPDPTIHGLIGMSQCFNGNQFVLTNYNSLGEATWRVFDENNQEVFRFNRTFITDTMRFTRCGRFRVELRIKFIDCEVVSDTFLVVKGPRAQIQDVYVDSLRIQNGFQCIARDTVFFTSSIPYLTCIEGNGPKFHLWDFGDLSAPSCTTDTRNGIHVVSNCRFSIDSVNAKHLYPPGVNACYRVALFVLDSLSGCSHGDTTLLPLMPPDAGPDLAAIPPRLGLRVQPTAGCLPSTHSFDVSETNPTCFKQQVWINYDSACGINNWIEINGNLADEYTYSQTCDSSGKITVGVIVRNGVDGLGNVCYDTAWYHHIITIDTINPAFSSQVIRPCRPGLFQANMDDTIQSNVARIIWNFGNRFVYGSNDTVLVGISVFSPNDTLIQEYAPGDSILRPAHIPIRSGVVSLLNRVFGRNGCVQEFAETRAFGYARLIYFNGERFCVEDSVEGKARIQYYGLNTPDLLDPVRYWELPQREIEGKEAVYWDIGDGKGFVHKGAQVKFKYDAPGLYTIRLAIKDSSGCLDTIVFNDRIRVYQARAYISSMQQNYLCAPQIVQFTDSSMVWIAPSVRGGISDDQIQTRLWSFGDQTTPSLLLNPAHNFERNDSFLVQLVVTSFEGCNDTADITIRLSGPQPSFVIGDVLGCAPFEALFENTTPTQLDNWTWYFGDSANSVLTVGNLNPVRFRYPKPGKYSVRLLGTQEIINTTTGNRIVCNATFPDPVTGLPERVVEVLPNAATSLTVDTLVCVDEVFSIIHNVDTLVPSNRWNFGDGNSELRSRLENVKTYAYRQSGTYTVELIPQVNSREICANNPSATIRVLDIVSAIEVDSQQTTPWIFSNGGSATNANNWWVFKEQQLHQQSSGTNFQLIWQAADTGFFTVCLSARNEADCLDSSCIRFYREPTQVEIPNVFTPSESDQKNDAFDIRIRGEDYYELKIYNRWGRLVFEGNRDGEGNDGMNWNGREYNDGNECAAGVYYFIFSYRYRGMTQTNEVHGTVTLIR